MSNLNIFQNKQQTESVKNGILSKLLALRKNKPPTKTSIDCQQACPLYRSCWAMGEYDDFAQGEYTVHPDFCWLDFCRVTADAISKFICIEEY